MAHHRAGVTWPSWPPPLGARHSCGFCWSCLLNGPSLSAVSRPSSPVRPMPLLPASCPLTCRSCMSAPFRDQLSHVPMSPVLRTLVLPFVISVPCSPVPSHRHRFSILRSSDFVLLHPVPGHVLGYLDQITWWGCLGRGQPQKVEGALAGKRRLKALCAEMWLRVANRDIRWQ